MAFILQWPKAIPAFLMMFPITSLAQDSRKGFDSVRWISPNQMVRLSRGAFAKPLGVVLDSKGKEQMKVDSPPPHVPGSTFGVLHFVNQAFFWSRTLRVVTEEGTFRESELLKYEDKQWNRVAFFRASTPPPALFPLEGERVLAVDETGKHFKSGSQPVPFAILKPNPKGELQVFSTFDAELEKPFFSSQGRGNYPLLKLDFMSFNHARTDNYLVLASVYGWFWVFDAEKGHLKRVVKLFSGVEDKHLRENELITALHGFQSRQDGKVLIASRLEDAVLWGRVGRPRPGGSPEEALAKLRTWSEGINQKFPHVDWWILDPQTGKVTLEAPPQNFPTRLLTHQQAVDFNWRFKPNGNLELLSMKEVQGDPANANEGLKRFLGTPK